MKRRKIDYNKLPDINVRCLNPVHIKGIKKNGTLYDLIVPCGKCECCLVTRKSFWSFRLREHFKTCTSGWFVTLTYNDNCLSYNSGVVLHPYPFPVVSSEHVRNFFKRLRKKINEYWLSRKLVTVDDTLVKPKISYFLVSEYGPETLRPHYHFLLFDVPDYIPYLDKVIEDVWGKGFITMSPITDERINYVSKYCCLPSVLPDYIMKYAKPFMRCSKGIGLSYVENADNYDYHRGSSVLRPYIEKGKSKVPLPRYYKDKIYTDDEKDFFLMENWYRSMSRQAFYRWMCTHFSGEEIQEYFRVKNSELVDYCNRVRSKAKKGQL